VADDFLPRPHR